MPGNPITQTQKIELQRLYHLLSAAALSAAGALGTGSAMPIGLPLERFVAFDERVADITRRIRDLLDQSNV